jgi:hypothetical protein
MTTTTFYKPFGWVFLVFMLNTSTVFAQQDSLQMRVRMMFDSISSNGFNIALSPESQTFLEQNLPQIEAKSRTQPTYATTFGEAALCLTTNVTLLNSDYTTSTRLIQKATKILSQTPQRDTWANLILANVYSHKGLNEEQFRQLEQAEESHALAIANYDQLPDSLALGKISEYQNLCRLHVKRNDINRLSQSLNLYEKSIKDNEKVRESYPDGYQI